MIYQPQHQGQLFELQPPVGPRGDDEVLLCSEHGKPRSRRKLVHDPATNAWHCVPFDACRRGRAAHPFSPLVPLAARRQRDFGGSSADDDPGPNEASVSKLQDDNDFGSDHLGGSLDLTESNLWVPHPVELETTRDAARVALMPIGLASPATAAAGKTVPSVSVTPLPASSWLAPSSSTAPLLKSESDRGGTALSISASSGAASASSGPRQAYLPHQHQHQQQQQHSLHQQRSNPQVTPGTSHMPQHVDPSAFPGPMLEVFSSSFAAVQTAIPHPQDLHSQPVFLQSPQPAAHALTGFVNPGMPLYSASMGGQQQQHQQHQQHQQFLASGAAPGGGSPLLTYHQAMGGSSTPLGGSPPTQFLPSGSIMIPVSLVYLPPGSQQ